MTPKEKAMQEFNAYIRERDCKLYGRCISCGAPITPTTCDAGHYVPCVKESTRFDERNVNAQCKVCNQLNYGNLPGYTRGLMERYGDIVDGLIRRGRQTVKRSKSDYEEIASIYRQKRKELL